MRRPSGGRWMAALAALAGLVLLFQQLQPDQLYRLEQRGVKLESSLSRLHAQLAADQSTGRNALSPLVDLPAHAAAELLALPQPDFLPPPRSVQELYTRLLRLLFARDQLPIDFDKGEWLGCFRHTGLDGSCDNEGTLERVQLQSFFRASAARRLSGPCLAWGERGDGTGGDYIPRFFGPVCAEDWDWQYSPEQPQVNPEARVVTGHLSKPIPRSLYDYFGLTLATQAPSPSEWLSRLQVFEHVDDPEAATRTLFRLTKPGGVVLHSSPVLEPLHSAPHDFFRYTAAGIGSLYARAGFCVDQAAMTGSFAVGTGYLMGLGAADFSSEELSLTEQSRYALGTHLVLRKPEPGAGCAEPPASERPTPGGVRVAPGLAQPQQVTPLDEWLGLTDESAGAVAGALRGFAADPELRQLLEKRGLVQPLDLKQPGHGSWLAELWARLHRVLATARFLPLPSPAAEESIASYYAQRWLSDHSELVAGNCVVWVGPGLAIPPHKLAGCGTIYQITDGAPKSAMWGKGISVAEANTSLAGRVNLVVFVHVLEQQPLPGVALQLAHRLLQAGGQLLLSAGFHRIAQSEDDFWRPTTFGLGVMAERAGFRLLERDYWGNPLAVMAQLVNMRADELTEAELLSTKGHTEDGDDENDPELRHRYYKVSSHILAQK